MPTVVVLVVVALAAVLDVFGFTDLIPAVAKMAFLVVPVIFAVSLAVGLSARKRA